MNPAKGRKYAFKPSEQLVNYQFILNKQFFVSVTSVNTKNTFRTTKSTFHKAKKTNSLHVAHARGANSDFKQRQGRQERL